MRQYQYFMLMCKANGSHSKKYALECLYQMFLVKSLLAPRESSPGANVVYLSTVGILGCNQATYLIVLRGPQITWKILVALLKAAPSCLIAGKSPTRKRGSGTKTSTTLHCLTKIAPNLWRLCISITLKILYTTRFLSMVTWPSKHGNEALLKQSWFF